MIGRKFGRLIVLSLAENNTKKHRRWVCACNCGSVSIKYDSHLKSGKSQSCGCLRSEYNSEGHKTHGYTKTRTYTIWQGMKSRCNNPNVKHWSTYGGRGISVCDRWLSFENFLTDMGVRPFPNAQLDRINNDEGYSPDNCRWVTQTQNARNKSNTSVITFNGVEMPAIEVAESLGIKPRIFRQRKSRGWSEERIINQPIREAR